MKTQTKSKLAVLINVIQLLRVKAAQAKASATEAKLQLRQAKRRRKEALISGISILFRPQQIEK